MSCWVWLSSIAFITPVNLSLCGWNSTFPCCHGKGHHRHRALSAGLLKFARFLPSLRWLVLSPLRLNPNSAIWSSSSSSFAFGESVDPEDSSTRLKVTISLHRSPRRMARIFCCPQFGCGYGLWSASFHLSLSASSSHDTGWLSLFWSWKFHL